MSQASRRSTTLARALLAVRKAGHEMTQLEIDEAGKIVVRLAKSPQSPSPLQHQLAE